ncbi:MAG: hypothetical protein MK291_13265 [Planctomycetes bacterium]|nr:hypothetical protein [Planctomycetota bacterium]
MLFIPDIADPLEEEQRQDVALPVGPIDRRAAQDVGGFPEVGLELCLTEPTDVNKKTLAKWFAVLRTSDKNFRRLSIVGD